MGSVVWGWCLSDHPRCGVMGRECLGHFLEEVLCCLKVGLKVLWEPGGGWPHPGLELQRW